MSWRRSAATYLSLLCLCHCMTVQSLYTLSVAAAARAGPVVRQNPTIWYLFPQVCAQDMSVCTHCMNVRVISLCAYAQGRLFRPATKRRLGASMGSALVQTIAAVLDRRKRRGCTCWTLRCLGVSHPQGDSNCLCRYISSSILVLWNWQWNEQVLHANKALIFARRKQ